MYRLHRAMLAYQDARGQADSVISDLSPAAWFKKGTGITESGGAVSQWADQSGNSRHLLQATGSAQPALQGDGTILFDGGSDFMKCTAFTLDIPAALAIVFKAVSFTNSDYFCDGNTTNSFALYQDNGVGSRVIARSGNSTASDLTSVGTGAYRAVIAKYSAIGAVTMRIDGTDYAALSGSTITNPGGFTLGAVAGGGGNWSNIQVAEAILLPAIPTGDDATNLDIYLAAIRDSL